MLDFDLKLGIGITHWVADYDVVVVVVVVVAVLDGANFIHIMCLPFMRFGTSSWR